MFALCYMKNQGRGGGGYLLGKFLVPIKLGKMEKKLNFLLNWENTCSVIFAQVGNFIF